MLHYALLPYHSKWERFWKKLRFVIVDEMHTYRGIFGSHVAQILGRLQRICRFYGSAPQFILLSATIANPQELAQQLIGKQPDGIEVIPENGAPQAKRHFVFMEPEEGLGGHVSSLAARLIVKAAEGGLKTIAFTQSRKVTELIHMSVLRAAPQLANRVSSYRAGFLPEERRTIEQKLSSGQLAAVISTSALEMGIDIGGLDLCILVGLSGDGHEHLAARRPGRAKRAGIGDHPAAAIRCSGSIHRSSSPGSSSTAATKSPSPIPSMKKFSRPTSPVLRLNCPWKYRKSPAREQPFRNLVDALTKTGKLLQTGDGNAMAVSLRSIPTGRSIFALLARHTSF